MSTNYNYFKWSTFFILFSLISRAQVVSTFAGSTSGYADGVVTAAQFITPEGMCVDMAGNIYVADNDFNNHITHIRKITPAGVVTTLFNSSGSGSFMAGIVKGICVDLAGNVYVNGVNKIIKLTQSGVESAFAGSYIGYGSNDGIGTFAKFYQPSGLCIDSVGNIYVADTNNHRIRKISPVGVVTTLAGSNQGYADGIGTAAQFNSPNGVCIDSVGNVYVADTNNNRIRKITPAGLVTTLAGSLDGYADGIGTAALFGYVTEGVCTDITGNVYVVDNGNGKVRKITPAGIVTTLAGSNQGYADGIGTAAQFLYPRGICMDANGNIYVSEMNHIRKITISPLDVNENMLSNKGVTIYPNPVQDQFTLDFGDTIVSNYTVKINNLLGQEVYSSVIDKPQFEVHKTWTGQGIYFVNILDAQGHTLDVRKIIMQ